MCQRIQSENGIFLVLLYSYRIYDKIKNSKGGKHMNTDTIQLFDIHNNFVPNFDEEIEKVLKSIHGEDYYDVDEALVNTNLITLPEMEENEELEKTIEFVDNMTEDTVRIHIVEQEQKKKKISIKDFMPLLFFVIIFSIIFIAGYYFLNTVDLMSFIK